MYIPLEKETRDAPRARSWDASGGFFVVLPVVEIPKVKDSKDGPKTTQQGLKLFAAKQRPGPEQVALAAEVNVPGSWFTWDESSRAERQEYYRAVALEFEERHVFEPAARGKPAKLDAAIMITSELCVWSGCWWVLGVLSTQPWLGAGC